MKKFFKNVFVKKIITLAIVGVSVIYIMYSIGILETVSLTLQNILPFTLIR